MKINNVELSDDEKSLLQELLERRNEGKKYRLYIKSPVYDNVKRYVVVKDWNTGEFVLDHDYNATKFTAKQYPHWKNDFMQVEELHYKFEPEWK